MILIRVSELSRVWAYDSFSCAVSYTNFTRQEDTPPVLYGLSGAKKPSMMRRLECRRNMCLYQLIDKFSNASSLRYLIRSPGHADIILDNVVL